MIRRVALTGLIGVLGTFQSLASPPNNNRAKVQAQNQSQSKDIQASLKTAVTDSQKKLGQLDPWQQKLFDEEVVPQYQRFVKDYRPSAQGTSVEVDLDAIKKYLAFYGPKLTTKKDPKVLVWFDLQKNCDKCTQSLEPVKALAKARLERRGFVPVWMPVEDAEQSDVGARKAFEEKALAASTQKGATGALILHLRTAPVDTIDTAHADESHYIVRTYFATLGGNTFHHEDQLELLQEDPMDYAAAKLLTDGFTELGSKTLLVRSAQEEEGAPELLLTIQNIRDYSTFLKIKDQLENQVKSLTSIEERKMGRNQFTFSIKVNRPLDEVKKNLSSVVTESGRLHVIESNEQMIRAEVK